MPLGQVAERMFHGLACELHSMQIRRRVAADMFGMAPRAYLRKVRRAEESVTDHGYSLWQAVYEHIASTQGVELPSLIQRFHRDDEGVLRGVLSDLRDSGLVTTTGRGTTTVFVATSGRELGAQLARGSESTDELVWAVIYREGPLDRGQLAQFVGLPDRELDLVLQRLKDQARVYERAKRDRILLSTTATVPDNEAKERWEAATFEHYHAAVRALSTLLARPTAENTATATLTFNLWPGHPLQDDVERLFLRMRADADALRLRIEAFNQSRPQQKPERVVLYLGMCEDRPRIVESPSTVAPPISPDAEFDSEDGDE